MVYSIIRVQAEGRKVIYDLGTNCRGERIIVELSRMVPSNPLRKIRVWGPSGNLWAELPNCLSVSVDAVNAAGIYEAKYNPTRGISGEKWAMEDTPENRQRILGEIYRRAFEEVRE